MCNSSMIIGAVGLPEQGASDDGVAICSPDSTWSLSAGIFSHLSSRFILK